MPVIEPVGWDDLAPQLRDAIVAGQATRVIGNTLPVQQWAHRPEAATAWVQLLCALHGNARLDARLRELVRLRIAAFTQCETCQATRKSDDVTEDDVACLASDDARFTPRERAALAFADLFVTDYLAMGDDDFRHLAEHFDIEEITELAMLCALMLAGGRLGYVLGGLGGEQPAGGHEVNACVSRPQRICE